MQISANPFGVETGPAVLYGRQQGFLAIDVQESFALARHRRRGQILRGGRGANRDGPPPHLLIPEADFLGNLQWNRHGLAGFDPRLVRQAVGVGVYDKTARHLKARAQQPSQTGALTSHQRGVPAVNERSGVLLGSDHLALPVPRKARNPPVSLPTTIRLPTICGDEIDNPEPGFF